MKTHIIFLSFALAVVLLYNSFSQIMRDRMILFEYDHTFGKTAQVENYEIKREYISLKHELIAPGRLQPVSWQAGTHSHHDHFSPNISALASTLTDIITIDLMIVYTDAAEEWSDRSGFGSINAVIAEAMNLSQIALDNSEVFIELRLVHVHKTDYDGTQLNPQSGMTHLRRLTASKDHNPCTSRMGTFISDSAPRPGL